MAGKFCRYQEFRFWVIWTQEARKGNCDRADGAEYFRVLDEWADDGCPQSIARFIQQHANLGPRPRPKRR